MASLGHIVVGMAAARAYRPGRAVERASAAAMLLWSALSFLPDADVIGFAFGVRYADEWGHRGASHSFVFSLMLGGAAALIAGVLRQPVLRTGIMATLVVASHVVLDTFTDGGLGCALFWPFDLTRYFAPWRPIPVSPIGLGYLSPYGMFVAVTEIVLFSPLLWYALRSRAPDARAPRAYVLVALLMSWLVMMWLLLSTDPIRERTVSAILRDPTQFAAGYSESELAGITPGQSPQDVRTRLGAPLLELLLFGERPNTCAMVRVESDAVVDAQPTDLCRTRGVKAGLSRAAVVQVLGAPPQNCWLYSRSSTGSYYRLRAVCFEADRVAAVIRRWMRE